ncbi:MAG: hypothetical protein ABGX20_00700 [Bacillus sp. (in: firmicutes)]
MDNISVKVKEAYDQYMPRESKFTEEDKQKVRNQIANMKKDRPKKKLELVPKALTVIVAAGFLLFTGGIVGKEIQFNGDLTNGQKENTAKLPSASTDDFYSKVEVGDKINGWELISKGKYGDASSTSISNLMQASFKGNAVLKGKLIFKANKLLFIPNKESFKLLPLQQKTTSELLIDFQNQSQVEKMFGIHPAEEKQNVTFEIDQYTVNYKKGFLIPHTVNVAFLIQTNGRELLQETKLKSDAWGHIQLPNRLQKLYDLFSKTKEEKLLTDLTPFDIFQLYYYTEEKKDFKTQYALYIKGPEYESPFKSAEEYLAAANRPADQKGRLSILEIVKTAQLEEKVTSHSDAHIMISKETGLGFGLIKDKQGIWKVKWMPLQ